MNRRPSTFPRRLALVVLGAACTIGAATGLVQVRSAPAAQTSTTEPLARKVGIDQVRVTQSQVPELKVAPAQSRIFEQRRQAIGIIDFDQDHQVQVLSPYQGRIGRVAVRAGDDVTAGALLYTVLVPDLPQAAAALVTASGNLKVANETLARARQLVTTQSISQKELQQNVADQQSAEAAWRSARKTLALFGLSDADIDGIEQGRRIDNEMPVRSPQAGRVVARSAAPGLLVQPGTSPAPVVVADLRRLWMVASVPESEVGAYRVGQPMQVQVPAYPGQTFAANVTLVGDAADPATRRFVVRATVANAQGLLKPQMSAAFTVAVGAPLRGVAVSANAVVRENDGRMVVWATRDGTTFQRRTIRTGISQDGFVQVTEGLQAGEQVAQDRALFLSNLYFSAE